MAEDPGYVHYANGVDATEAAHWWIREFPAAAVRVLLGTGALELYSACGRCAGRDTCQWVDSMSDDVPDCLPVYRFRHEESTQ
jgi:hypothetical protein